MFNYNRISEIEFFEDNIVLPKSDYRSTFNNKEYSKLLNGYWSFSYEKNIGALKDIEYYFACKLSELDTIKVPGHIQLQGYGSCQYVNVQYPWDGLAPLKPGEIMHDDNPVGIYVHEFDFNCELLDSHYLEFLGAENAIAVWLNGSYIGYSEDSFTTTTFDITHSLKNKDNRLVVQVFKYSSGSWLEDQDFWRFSGIFRDVRVYSKPLEATQDLTIQTKISNDYNTGKVNLNIPFSDNSQKQVKIHFNGQVTSITCTGSCLAELIVDDVKLWSAEKPNLYDLKIEILSRYTETIDTYVGFVEYKIEDAQVLVNGKRVIFNGVNRHEFSCLTGRYVTSEDMLNDLKIMKQHNINAIRTSHYPNHPDFYRLCDLLGFYVIDEMNLETHGSWQMQVKPFQKLPQEARYYYPGSDERVLPALLARARNMYYRDKNFVSVCMLSCGNESLGGENIFKVREFFKSLDSNRIIHYEGVFNDRSFDISDIESRMYDKIENVVEYLENSPEKPFIYCEYAHAMGNSLGNLDKYQALTRKYPSYQGGFIWEYKDHGLLIDGELKYGGDFGDRPCDYNFVCDGIINADNSFTPKIAHVKYIYQPFYIQIDTVITIKNEYLFTNLNEFVIEICLTDKNGQVTIETVIVDCAPQEIIVLPYDNNARDIMVRILLEYATPLLDEMHVISYQQKVLCHEVLPATDLVQPSIIDGNYNVGLSVGKTKLLFSKVYGLNSIKHGGQELLVYPVKVNVGRAFIDNDRGANLEYTHGILNQMSTNQVFDVSIVGNRVCVRHHLSSILKMYCDVFYGFDTEESIIVEVNYPGFENCVDFLDFGLYFSFDRKFNFVNYLGYGPLENYCDRYTSSIFGQHQYSVTENFSNYIYPQECGNRYKVSKFELSNGVKALDFTALDDFFEFSVLPYSINQILEAKHISDLKVSNASYVRVSHKHSGVGGDDSWGARPHQEFLINSQQPLNYKFKIQIK